MNDFDEQPAEKHAAEEGEKEQRFRGDLDCFRLSSFKSQHHLSNLMLDDFVEIYSNKKQAAKTISCCFHYLMHLQFSKWTRKQIITGRRKTAIFISQPEKTISEMGDTPEEFVWYVLRAHYREPSSVHSAPCNRTSLCCVRLPL